MYLYKDCSFLNIQKKKEKAAQVYKWVFLLLCLFIKSYINKIPNAILTIAFLLDRLIYFGRKVYSNQIGQYCNAVTPFMTSIHDCDKRICLFIMHHVVVRRLRRCKEILFLEFGVPQALVMGPSFYTIYQITPNLK